MRYRSKRRTYRRPRRATKSRAYTRTRRTTRGRRAYGRRGRGIYSPSFRKNDQEVVYKLQAYTFTTTSTSDTIFQAYVQLNQFSSEAKPLLAFASYREYKITYLKFTFTPRFQRPTIASTADDVTFGDYPNRIAVGLEPNYDNNPASYQAALNCTGAKTYSPYKQFQIKGKPWLTQAIYDSTYQPYNINQPIMGRASTKWVNYVDFASLSLSNTLRHQLGYVAIPLVNTGKANQYWDVNITAWIHLRSPNKTQ